MTWQEYATLVKADFHRYQGKWRMGLFLRYVLFNPSVKYSFLMRTCNYTRSQKGLLPFFVVFRILLRHYRFRYGISIPYSTKIGAGFFISHPGDIVVNDKAVIGSNCNISQGVTIGFNLGASPGIPSIGDACYIGPGAKILGGITIGKNCAIGANCVVITDIPDNSVVVGVPGKVVSGKGASDFILNPVSVGTEDDILQ